ncbi:hypothetical protein DFH11DRAFT_1689859 [Phellopilus nigrolimitatus]|nr:hypothetical protein DFH11DRAFT_1689859 [Phellopilus nigrolimitatus]
MASFEPLDTKHPRPASVQSPTPTEETAVVWQRPSSADSQLEYRVEERRRTIIVTSSVPPDEWDDDTREKISLELSSAPEKLNTYSPSSCRRTHSCNTEFSSKPKFATDEPQSIGTGHFASSGPPQKLKKPPSPLRGIFKRHSIYFYNREDPHYGFTNFSSHAVEYNGKVYPTSEHLFQSFKFQGHRPLLAEHIRLFSDRPSAALSEARRFQPEVRSDWKSVNMEMMDIALWHKFNQHQDLKQELLDTGNAELIEVQAADLGMM